jgi:two-component system chemotaxis response regulator CheB
LRLKERIRHQFRGAGVRPPVARPERIPPSQGKAGPSSGLVLIGTSTGGPAALDVVLPQLPAGFPRPVLVAQHMPASFTGPFARRLDRQCNLQVVEVDRPMPLLAGTIYIGRGDADLVVSARARGMIAMSAPAQRSYPWHPSAERMVISALEQFDAARLIGVLMTGMGRDGADAMTRLRKDGGRTIAEAESTAVVWGMPGELVKNGGAELVCPLEEIAAAIIEMVQADAPH